jgi:outer membrane protein TolC
VLQAQKEVADALANLDSASQQEQAQREAAAAAAEALALAELRFAAGAED